MASFTNGDRYSETAGADLSQKRYHIVKTNSSLKVVLSTGGTDNHLGVLDGEPKVGQTADVVLANGQGTFKVKAGADIAKDAKITSNANGQAVTATAGDRVIGYAYRAAVTGEIFEYVKLNEKA